MIESPDFWRNCQPERTSSQQRLIEGAQILINAAVVSNRWLTFEGESPSVCTPTVYFSLTNIESINHAEAFRKPAARDRLAHLDRGIGHNGSPEKFLREAGLRSKTKRLQRRDLSLAEDGAANRTR
jgi:hypothetical protein